MNLLKETPADAVSLPVRSYIFFLISWAIKVKDRFDGFAGFYCCESVWYFQRWHISFNSIENGQAEPFGLPFRDIFKAVNQCSDDSTKTLWDRAFGENFTFPQGPITFLNTILCSHNILREFVFRHQTESTFLFCSKIFLPIPFTFMMSSIFSK